MKKETFYRSMKTEGKLHLDASIGYRYDVHTAGGDRITFYIANRGTCWDITERQTGFCLGPRTKTRRDALAYITQEIVELTYKAIQRADNAILTLVDQEYLKTEAGVC